EGIEWTNDGAVLRARLQAKLEVMLGSGNVRVFEIADGEFDIAFCGQLAGARISPLYVLGTPAGITANITEKNPGFGNEVQRLSFSGGTDGELLTLSYGRLLTQRIEWTSDAVALRGRIQN